jgi:hypothetical protein
VAAAGAWRDDRTFELAVCYRETPFIATLTCRFEGDDLTIARQTNVSFGETTGPELRGRAA